MVQFDSGRQCGHGRSPSASLRAGSRPAGENAGLRDDAFGGAARDDGAAFFTNCLHPSDKREAAVEQDEDAIRIGGFDR